jgi:hypothetical protein
MYSPRNFSPFNKTSSCFVSYVDESGRVVSTVPLDAGVSLPLTVLDVILSGEEVFLISRIVTSIRHFPEPCSSEN